jgi:curved DNA-binding protein CbpA
MKTPEEPFAVLGLAPTLDVGAIKRAYFAALARHPPHQDPEGFGRLRSAYEVLTRPGGLAAAYLASAVDVQRLADEARERFDAALQKASEAAAAVRDGEEASAQFLERCSRMRWDEALRACAGDGGR